jgi:hypothetical protein
MTMRFLRLIDGLPPKVIEKYPPIADRIGGEYFYDLLVGDWYHAPDSGNHTFPPLLRTATDNVPKHYRVQALLLS